MCLEIIRKVNREIEQVIRITKNMNLIQENLKKRRKWRIYQTERMDRKILF